MSTAAAQHYANHQHRPTWWSLTWLLAVAVCLALLWQAVAGPTLQTILAAGAGVALVSTVTLVRAFALRLQNRIIRLEMQVRLSRLGLLHAAESLTLPQLIAVRFASDAELPALLARAADERLSPDQIKRAVTHWQGDHLRT